MLKILPLLAVLFPAPAADPISGTWQIRGDVMGNPLDQVCTIEQKGTALRGSCAGQGAATVEITGEVKDGKVTFKHAGEYGGEALTIVYSGTLASPQEIKGTVEVQPMTVTGVFTATPAPAKQ